MSIHARRTQRNGERPVAMERDWIRARTRLGISTASAESQVQSERVGRIIQEVGVSIEAGATVLGYHPRGDSLFPHDFYVSGWQKGEPVVLSECSLPQFCPITILIYLWPVAFEAVYRFKYTLRL